MTELTDEIVAEAAGNAPERGRWLTSLAIELCERGLVPDAVMRLGMRRLLAQRLRQESLDGDEREFELFRERLAGLRRSRVALATDRANEQHYELPAGFFEAVLGPHLKYSCAFWQPGVEDLGEAERQMLTLTCARAEIADGQDILELGCGWGSLTLWMAERYPRARITAVSNSASQREFILARAAARGLANVTVITADANDFEAGGSFDRVVSVEMFEHVRNYEVLMARIAGWLRPGGKLFVHIFCHRRLLYPFTTGRDDDWMGRHFFTGGLMPSEHTLLYFQRELCLEEQWRVSGRHYARTADAWLAAMDQRRDAIMPVLGHSYGAAAAERWFNRWRMFFMACAELFGYRNGTEWLVAHYRFTR
jgi:cyclopropane-fatty-acyl-phospholipid synthase